MLAIETFGKFWREDKIYWGRGRNKGHLKGYLKGNKKKIVDFRKQFGIYVLFDETRRPIYVGQAGLGNANLFDRLRTHKADHLRDRWVYFSWFGLKRVNKSNEPTLHQKPESWISGRKRKDALHETEAVLMSVVETGLNKRGPNWTGTQEYYQWVEVVSDEPGVILRSLPKRLEKIEMQISKLRRKK